jgi:hypothetical protein
MRADPPFGAPSQLSARLPDWAPNGYSVATSQSAMRQRRDAILRFPGVQTGPHWQSLLRPLPTTAIGLVPSSADDGDWFGPGPVKVRRLVVTSGCLRGPVAVRAGRPGVGSGGLGRCRRCRAERRVLVAHQRSVGEDAAAPAVKSHDQVEDPLRVAAGGRQDDRGDQGEQG